MVLFHCDSACAVIHLKDLVNLFHANRLEASDKRKHVDLSAVDIQWCIRTCFDALL